MERTREQELMKLIDQLISTKLTEDENYLRFSFYEVRVKGKVEESEEKRFLESKVKLYNKVCDAKSILNEVSKIRNLVDEQRSRASKYEKNL